LTRSSRKRTSGHVRRLGRLGKADVATHHHARQIRTCGASSRRVADHAPVAQHGHAVGQLQNFVQLVRDEDQPVAVGGHLAQNDKEIGHFLRCEHGRRLVEHEQRRAAVERLDDLDALLLSHRQITDHCVGIHLQPIAFGQFENAPASPAPDRPSAGARSAGPARRFRHR
jgi:hypothetical protein